MIAFRNSKPEGEDDLNAKLQKLLDIINQDKVLPQGFDFDELNKIKIGELYNAVSLVDINDIIYRALYDNDNDSIDLTIYKNPNNSMDMIINEVNDGM
jgi:hypothetical protein